MNKNRFRCYAGIVAVLFGVAASASDWSAQTHDLYPGDFNADGRTDALYVAKSSGASATSGIALSNAAEWVTGLQSWGATGFGIPWHSNTYLPIIGDFNWDGRDDIFMHRQSPGDHFLLLAQANGTFTGVNQTIPNTYAGLVWSADQHRIIAIKAAGSGTRGHRLFLQAVAKGGSSAIIDTGPTQLIGSSTVGSAWTDGYRGFQWNLRQSLVHSGDFNGDGHGELLIQAQPDIVLIDYDVPIPVPTYRPQSFGIVYSPVSTGVTLSWDRMQAGVDWSATSSNLIIGNFDDDSRDDIIVQPRRAGGSVYLVRTNPSTNQPNLTSPTAISFSGASTASADSYRLLAANINGSLSGDSTFGVYLQSVPASGTDLIAHAIPTAGGTAATQSAPVPGQTERPYTTVTRYNLSGQVTGTIAPDPDGAGPLRHPAMRNTYNARGLLEKTESGELGAWLDETVAPNDWGSRTTFSVFTTAEFTYDNYGRKATERVKGVDASAESLVQYSYDSQSRVQCKAVRMNKSAYGALPGSACDQGSAGSFGPDRISRLTYDVYDQVLTEERGVGTSLEQTYVTNTYDGHLLRTQTDANGNMTELQYNAYARLERRLYPSSTVPGTVNSADYNEYTYEANGNVLTERKRNGTIITNTWDGNNRLIVKDLSDNTYSQDVHYNYDLRGLTLHSRFGSDLGQGIVNTFDGFGRLQASTNNVDGVARTLSYLYDDNGNRTRVTHPDGYFFEYGFDGLNRVSGLSESTGSAPTAATTAALSLSYLPSGGRQNIIRTGGATTTLTRDNALRLGSFSQDFSATANDLTNTFRYNPASQVVELTQSNTLYAYVGNENRTGNYVPNGLNQYSTIAGQAVAYDANGNLTSDGSLTYTYDMENRLVATNGAVASSFTYDPLGRLFQVTIAGVTTRFFYDGDALVAEYDAGGTMTRRYVHGDQVDEPWVQYNGSTVGPSYRRYLHADHQGSIIAQSDNTGGVLSKLAYDSYGIPAPTNIDRFGYTGQAWLKELGLFHYKARMYSPKLGRFLQTDPIFYSDDFNLYAYVGNDPLNKTDPTGRNILTLTEGVVVLVIGVTVCELSGACDSLRNGLEDILNNEKNDDSGKPKEKPKSSPDVSNNDDPQEAEKSLTKVQEKAKRDKEGRSIVDPASDFEGASKRPKQADVAEGKRSKQRAQHHRQRDSSAGDYSSGGDDEPPPEPDIEIPPDLRDKYIIRKD